MKQYQHYNSLPASDDICRLMITFENSFHSDQKVSEYDQEIPQSHTVDQMCFASENIVNNNNNNIPRHYEEEPQNSYSNRTSKRHIKAKQPASSSR